MLAKYAFGLAQTFNAFYHRYPILNEERSDRKRWRAAGVAYVRAQLTREVAQGFIRGDRVLEDGQAVGRKRLDRRRKRLSRQQRTDPRQRAAHILLGRLEVDAVPEQHDHKRRALARRRLHRVSARDSLHGIGHWHAHLAVDDFRRSAGVRSDHDDRGHRDVGQKVLLHLGRREDPGSEKQDHPKEDDDTESK